MCRRPYYLITIKINVQQYDTRSPPHNNVLVRCRYDHDFFVCNNINNINTSSGGGRKY